MQTILIRQTEEKKVRDRIYFIQCGKCKKVKRISYACYRAIFPARKNTKQKTSGWCVACKNTKPNKGSFQKNQISWNKGLKGVQKSFWKGKKRNKETIAKMIKGNFVSCKWCEKEVWIVPSYIKKYCSKKCYAEWMIKNEKFKGKNNPKWKGGITPLVLQIRHCRKSIEWRNKIFKRDNYTCRRCKKRGQEIHAHHYPKSFSQIFNDYQIKTLKEALNCKEFWNIENGRTLCKRCHYDKRTNYKLKSADIKTKIIKKVGGGVPFAKKAEYEYEGVKYAADLKNGDTIKILDAGIIEPGTYGEQHNFRIETRNGEKKQSFNQATLNVLHDELGEESENWINKDARVILKKDTIAGKKVIIAYFVVGDWNLDEYGELCKKGEVKVDEKTDENPY